MHHQRVQRPASSVERCRALVAAPWTLRPFERLLQGPELDADCYRGGSRRPLLRRRRQGPRHPFRRDLRRPCGSDVVRAFLSVGQPTDRRQLHARRGVPVQLRRGDRYGHPQRGGQLHRSDPCCRDFGRYGQSHRLWARQHDLRREKLDRLADRLHRCRVLRPYWRPSRFPFYPHVGGQDLANGDRARVTKRLRLGQ
jgi:hypothetical protein